MHASGFRILVACLLLLPANFLSSRLLLLHATSPYCRNWVADFSICVCVLVYLQLVSLVSSSTILPIVGEICGFRIVQLEKLGCRLQYNLKETPSNSIINRSVSSSWIS